MVDVNFAIAFISGLSIGISPCILLMLSVFGTSLILTEEKRKFIVISVGLLSGMILAYILISIIFLYFFQLLENFFISSYIFATILIIIGIWEIIECKKEHSTIYRTPEKVKTVLKNFIEQNSGFYAFLVGIIFVLIKVPCFGPIYLSLLYNLQNNPLLFFFIFIYLLGMIIPIIILLILTRLGLESTKLNEYRLKYRPYLRILSGLILIFLAIYLLVNQIMLI
ncbi:MAG: cytochrome c biogenesis protein CcdA [Promethearchaeota archaeon]